MNKGGQVSRGETIGQQVLDLANNDPGEFSVLLQILARDKKVHAEIIKFMRYRQEQTERIVLTPERIREIVASPRTVTKDKIKKASDKHNFTDNQIERTYLGMAFEVLCEIGVKVKPEERTVKLSRKQFAEYLNLCRTEFSKSSTYYIRYGTRKGRSDLPKNSELIEKLNQIEGELKKDILKVVEEI